MMSSLRAGLWILALVLFVTAAYSLTLWMNRAPRGQAQSEAAPALLALPANAAETQTPAPAPRPFGQPGPYIARKSNPGDDLYRAGQYEKAIAYWTDMAKVGDAEANYRLGQEYFYSKSGVLPRDQGKAREYFLAGAKLGESRCMFEVATIYEYGAGVPASLPEAAKWYKRSADYGDAQGQYNYATIVETGEGGVAIDKVEAYKYFLLAAAQGFYGVGYDPQKQRADSKLPTPIEILSKQLTEAQRSEGQLRAKVFKVLTGPLAL